MDSVLEKFSIFDFFNLIFTGIVFLISLLFIGLHLLDVISSVFFNSAFITMLMKKFSTESDNTIAFIMIAYFIFLLAISYVIGSVIQELGSFIQNRIFKIQDNAIASVLNDSSIINNEIKREICVKEAKELFRRKNIKLKNGENFTSVQSHYFYTYCIYYIQIREQHKKPEKMRGIQGISNMLSTSFALSAFCGIITYIFQSQLANVPCVQKIDIKYLILILLIYISLSIIFWIRMKKNILYRIRMVLNTYEANIDKETLP